MISHRANPRCTRPFHYLRGALLPLRHHISQYSMYRCSQYHLQLEAGTRDHLLLAL